MSQDQLVDKYRQCARMALSSERVEGSLSLLKQLEWLTSIKELVTVILPEPRA
jgi:hypothetical protein